MDVNYGLLAKLQARPGRADDLAKLLETARRTGRSRERHGDLVRLQNR